MKRYDRQIAYSNIGEEGQKAIKNGTVAIVGAGALGSRAAELLTRAGIGRLILIDSDTVELSNLQRQTLFEESDVGVSKCESLKSHLGKINSNVKVDIHDTNFTLKTVDLLKDADVVLGCTDTLESRFLINEYCRKKKIPWVNGAAAGSIGTMMVTLPKGPCFRCVHQEVDGIVTANEVGILNSVVSVVAAFQIDETLKVLVGASPESGLIHVDVWMNIFNKVLLSSDPTCPVCSGKFEYLK